MAIYHLSCQVISRKAGRSSVAASAYRAGARMADARTGVVHDYTRKGGVVASAVFLPEHAPAEWADRSALWNAVEAHAKRGDARLCREFNVALPRELTEAQRWELAQRFARGLAAQGMCVDLAMHNPKGGGNPHFHAMATVNPCDEGGFLPKTRQLYLVRKAGEKERMVPADQIGEGWAKVYVYKDGEKRTMAEAEAAGLDPKGDRKRRQPVSRRERITGGWDDEAELEKWREGWQDLANEALKKAGSAERIDHRSNAERGIDVTPTVHEGPTVREIERRSGDHGGPVTDIARQNAEAEAEAERDREREAERRRRRDERERAEVAALEAARDAEIEAIEEKANSQVAALLEERKEAPYLVPRFEEVGARRDLEAVSRHLAAEPQALPKDEADELAAALAATPRPARSGGDPVREAAGDARKAVNEVWGEYYDPKRPKDGLPDLLHLLLLAAERLRSMLARLLVLMEAAREAERERGLDAAIEAAAAWAVEQEARRRQALAQAARDDATAHGMPLADEPGVWEVVPPAMRRGDEERQG